MLSEGSLKQEHIIHESADKALEQVKLIYGTKITQGNGCLWGDEGED